MLKLYKEHHNFDEFTEFNTELGTLNKISAETFFSYFPEDFSLPPNYPVIQKIKYKNNSIFLGETPETRVRFPRRIYFQITRNCNLSCDYCYIKSYKGAPHVPAVMIKEIVAFMGANGLMEVRLTGGEPTSHPDFIDIMHTFKEHNIYVSVATNGLWSGQIRDALCEEKHLWVICSLDGNRSTHNRYRPDTFDKIISNLTHLKNRNPSARIRLTTVLTRQNKDQMFQLGETAKLVDAESITVIPLRPQVRLSGVKEEMVHNTEFKQVIEDLIKAKKTFGVPFTTTMETDYKEEIFKDPIVRKKLSCAAGREATNLDYDASKKEFQVYGCSYSPASDLSVDFALRKPFLAGTFKADKIADFLDIWRNDELWNLYRDVTFRSQNCTNCLYLKKFQCTGSCPIQNIDYSSINLSQDVLKQLKEQIQMTGEWYCYKNFT